MENNNEQTIIALLKQKLDAFDKKLDCLAIKIDGLLSKKDAEDKYATKLELEKLRSKLNWYSWLVPMLSLIIGVLTRFLK